MRIKLEQYTASKDSTFAFVIKLQCSLCCRIPISLYKKTEKILSSRSLSMVKTTAINYLPLYLLLCDAFK